MIQDNGYEAPAGNVDPKSDPALQPADPTDGVGVDPSANTMLPAYCDPPNPCPIGYTSADGCIEDFENTSEFSRRYQASQNCICDTEHMFDCPNENAHRGPEDIAAAVSISIFFILNRFLHDFTNFFKLF